jgi:hypothetical protein
MRLIRPAILLVHRIVIATVTDDRMVSGDFVYELESPIIVSEDEQPQFVSARRSDDLEVTLKCAPLDTNIDSEFVIMKNLSEEVWVPRPYEIFTTESIECIAMDRISFDLPPTIETGLEMLMISETLHRKYELNHRGALASSWGTADGRLVLVDFAGIVSLEYDADGSHRIRELYQLVLTLRYLITGDGQFMDLKQIPSRDAKLFCATEESCPGLFEELIQAMFVYTEDWGELPPDMYPAIRGYLLSMVGYIDSYIDLQPLSKGESASIISAVSETTSERVVLKCSSEFVDGNLQAEYDLITRFQAESWAPRIYEFFEVPNLKLKCFAMEHLALSIAECGVTPIKDLAIMGYTMTKIVESLHLVYGVAHGDLHPGNWMLRDASDMSSLVLIDLGGSPIGDNTKFLKDIREIPISMRFLLDMNRKFYVAKRIKTNDIDVICPEKICPESLRTLVSYVLSREAGDVSIYNVMKLLITQII